jgi:hypothetical protein
VWGAHPVCTRLRDASHPSRRAGRDLHGRLPRGAVGIVDEPVEHHRRRRSDGQIGLILELELRRAGVGSPNVLVRKHTVACSDGAGASAENAGNVPHDGNRGADAGLSPRWRNGKKQQRGDNERHSATVGTWHGHDLPPEPLLRMMLSSATWPLNRFVRNGHFFLHRGTMDTAGGRAKSRPEHRLESGPRLFPGRISRRPRCAVRGVRCPAHRTGLGERGRPGGIGVARTVHQDRRRLLQGVTMGQAGVCLPAAEQVGGEIACRLGVPALSRRARSAGADSQGRRARGAALVTRMAMV